MVKVAVAGGTGGIGRHIVEGILATKNHTVIVLSRSSSNAQLEALGAQTVAVDYTNHSSLVAALQGVHTVISAIWVPDETLVTSQTALLRAAVEAEVKRFAPSVFGARALPDDPVKAWRYKSFASDAVEKSGLEWTFFENGVFMNYLASGTPGAGHLKPLKFVVDVENGTASVPGTGDQKMSFITAEDVGAFVAASLDLDKWPERCGIVGDVKTYNEVIMLAEGIRGQKFKVTYVSEDELRKSIAPNLPDLATNTFQEIMIEIASERFLYEANLNVLCPEVKPVGIGEFMKKWW